MTFVRKTTTYAGYATTGILVLFAVVTLWKWTQAGGARAMAEALAWTVLTLFVFAVQAALDHAQNRGEN